jgi:malonyl-CoA/methylmalonyl-CoA synthetase
MDHLSPADHGRGAADALTEGGTLVHAFLRRWAQDPSRPLWRERDGRWWTNAEFEEATRRAARRLLAAGLRPGDRVLWSIDPSVAALVTNVACLRAGLVLVPANPAYTEPELSAVVAATGPRGAVVDRDDRANWIRRASTQPVVVVGPELALPAARAGQSDSPSLDEHLDRVGPDDPALVGMTSGTTGAPKGAQLRQRHLLAGVASLGLAWRWAPEDRLVHCLPLFHSHGLCVGAYGTMAAGASGLLLGRFDPAAVADEAGAEGATLFFGVPTMYHRLVRSGRAGGLRGLRLCVSGSAPLPAALHAEASAAVGSTVLERYGMTETLMLTSNPYEGERRPGSVGFPLPWVEVRIDATPSDGSGGERADADMMGEVLVRGPNVFDGYLGRPEATAAAFVDAAETADGDHGGPWFRTGDLGTVDDGYLSILGRAKELIISGGYNIRPGEVEEALAGCPGVAEVAVTGTPSAEFGEEVTAWVVADGRAPSLAELAGYSERSLAPYKRPRRLHVVDTLPRTALGKVVRGRLADADAVTDVDTDDTTGAVGTTR